MPYSLDHITAAGSAIYIDAVYLYRPKLIQALLNTNSKKCIKDFAASGTLIKPLDELLSVFEKRGGQLTIARSARGNRREFSFKWKGGYVTVDHDCKTFGTNITCETVDPSLLDMQSILETEFLSKVKKNLVFTIMQSSSGLHIESLGDGSSPLFIDNYTTDVIEDYNFVIESFKKSPPNGRICILDGEPGCGKTFLIRNILSKLDAIFLIVPANLISSMEKPDFLPLLLRIKSDYSKPIIMIVEDGDICLVARKGDNISTIAALLNLSDGILGSMIDIKLIISSNAEIKDMDEAIMRPGRLCKRIHIGALDMDQANKVYQRILEDSSKTLEHRKHGYTLAEIYHQANNLNNPMVRTAPQSSQEKRVIGFHQNISPVDLTVNKLNE